MTKSPHSVTRLRLFELYRLLALLCVFKLCLFGVLLIDVDWGNFHEAVKTVAENGIQLDDDAGVKEETPSEAADADAASEDAVPQALAEATLKAAEAVESSPEREEPQGAEAARLAAEARPAPRPSTISSGLDDSTATAASVASAISIAILAVVPLAEKYAISAFPLISVSPESSTIEVRCRTSVGCTCIGYGLFILLELTPTQSYQRIYGKSDGSMQNKQTFGHRTPETTRACHCRNHNAEAARRQNACGGTRRLHQSDVWMKKDECSRRDSNPGNELGRLRS